MSFPTPPRGTGRHWRDDDQAGPADPRRGRYPRFEPADPPAPEPERYYPDEYGDVPTDPTMPAPLNQAPRRHVGEGTRRITVERAGQSRMPDMVVPRIYVEPDEQMDALRVRSLRWGIARDVVAVLVGLYLLGSWILPGVWRALGG